MRFTCLLICVSDSVFAEERLTYLSSGPDADNTRHPRPNVTLTAARACETNIECYGGFDKITRAYGMP